MSTWLPMPKQPVCGAMHGRVIDLGGTDTATMHGTVINLGGTGTATVHGSVIDLGGTGIATMHGLVIDLGCAGWGLATRIQSVCLHKSAQLTGFLPLTPSKFQLLPSALVYGTQLMETET